MRKRFTVMLATAALIGSAAVARAAGSGLPVVIHPSKPGAPALVSLSAEHLGPVVPRDDSSDARLVKIADNFARDPNSPYWGWSGYAAFGSGPQAGNGTQWWLAAPFTPTADHIATKVEVAAEHYLGTNAAVLGLYDDAGGLPGNELHSWQLSNLPHSVCCTVVGRSDQAGIPLTGGKQYWVVIRMNAKDANAVVLWALTESADVQEHGATWALYCSGSCPGWKNHAWNLFPNMLYGFAFSVLGK